MPSHSPIYDALAALIPDGVPRSLYIWDPPNTPLSTLPAASTAIVTYLAVIFGGRAIMKDRQPFGESLKIPFLVHNLALTVGSGALLAVMLEEIVPILRRGGPLYGICHEAAWTSVSASQSHFKTRISSPPPFTAPARAPGTVLLTRHATPIISYQPLRPLLQRLETFYM